MSEDLRTLREHLADARLYDGPANELATQAAVWRTALLGRYSTARRWQRVAAEGRAFWRVALLIALPLAIATAVTLLALAGVDLTPRIEVPAAADPRLQRPIDVPNYVWYGLAGLNVLLTFLVRRRLPRLLLRGW
ncbi:hypothetical protein FJ251_07820 [bacterium]|nr:hypothetical protein [bacterium]